jgi:hypothetical protein
MTDNIMAIPLIMMAFIMVFFLYKRVRIDLFRDKMFEIRRALFLIAAKDPQVFFEDNTYYRFFECIINATLSYTEDFSLFTSLLDNWIRKGYSKRTNTVLFNFSQIKEKYLEKVQSDEIRKEVSDLMDSFTFHYAVFLLTRSFLELIVFSCSTIVLTIHMTLKMFREEKRASTINKERLKAYIEKQYSSDSMMNNSQFAYASRLYA